ncbi:pyridoxamine 5'-phosphate oxidase family protein [Halorussus litoreus]|uniref:pyridoxamine 5'-phosphate oxidase family protein n=1 Tax=Halorussus litoreus TaxID=1710536 RepID=UPI000E269F5D|nr:pyridoxamine 5'-phosphate oxidase family protein [Halorussus litoreus]
MSESEIDSFLRERDSGVLSLSDGRESYAVPESFGYDGESIYFQMAYTDSSHKMSFMETTETATFTVYVDGLTASSVVARGPIEPVPEDEQLLAANALAENNVVPVLNVSTQMSVDELGFDFYRLRPEEITGRRFGPDV